MKIPVTSLWKNAWQEPELYTFKFGVPFYVFHLYPSALPWSQHVSYILCPQVVEDRCPIPSHLTIFFILKFRLKVFSQGSIPKNIYFFLKNGKVIIIFVYLWGYQNDVMISKYYIEITVAAVKLLGLTLCIWYFLSSWMTSLHCQKIQNTRAIS